MGDFTDSDGVLGQGEAETEVEEEMTREGSKGEQEKREVEGLIPKILRHIVTLSTIINNHFSQY